MRTLVSLFALALVLGVSQTARACDPNVNARVFIANDYGCHPQARVFFNNGYSGVRVSEFRVRNFNARGRVFGASAAASFGGGASAAFSSRGADIAATGGRDVTIFRGILGTTFIRSR